jgi:hypothetical protein
MSISGGYPFGPRSLAKDYVNKRLSTHRDEIRRKIQEKNGIPGVATWDKMDQDWLGGNVGDEGFIEFTVNMMENSEYREPSEELPDMSPITEDPRLGV